MITEREAQEATTAMQAWCAGVQIAGPFEEETFELDTNCKEHI